MVLIISFYSCLDLWRWALSLIFMAVMLLTCSSLCNLCFLSCSSLSLTISAAISALDFYFLAASSLFIWSMVSTRSEFLFCLASYDSFKKFDIYCLLSALRLAAWAAALFSYSAVVSFLRLLRTSLFSSDSFSISSISCLFFKNLAFFSSILS